jgi:hypothetical protein
MSSLRVHKLEVPEVAEFRKLMLVCWRESLFLLMGTLCLRNLQIGFWLACMDYIGKLHAVLNEKDRNIISDDIPVSFIGVELDSKSSDITNCIGTATASQDSRKTNEHWSCAARVS